MKNLKIDIYKSIFLLILGVFVYCYYENSGIGRFSKIFDGEGDIVLLDTKSGATYLIEFGGDGKVKNNTPSIIK